MKECNVIFNKKLKTWEENSMMFSLSLYGTLTSSWNVRNSSYHVSFLPSDGKHKLAVLEPLYLKERECGQFLSKIPSSTSRTASFTKKKVIMNIKYRPVSTLPLIGKIIFREASLSGSLRVLIPVSLWLQFHFQNEWRTRILYQYQFFLR